MEVNILNLLPFLIIAGIIVIVLTYNRLWEVAPPTDATVKTKFGRILPVEKRTGGIRINIPFFSQIFASVSVIKQQHVGRILTETKDGMTVVANYALLHQIIHDENGNFVPDAVRRWAQYDDEAQAKMLSIAAATAISEHVRSLSLQDLKAGKVPISGMSKSLEMYGRQPLELLLANPDFPANLRKQLDDLAEAKTEAEALSAYAKALGATSTASDVVELSKALAMRHLGRKSTVFFDARNSGNSLKDAAMNRIVKHDKGES